MSLRTQYLLACLLGMGAIATAESAAPPAPWVDAYGDPLPRGAVARLGTVRWRHDGASAFAFTRTGETLVSVAASAVQFWDVKTGKVVRSFPVENRFGPAQLSMPIAGDVVVAGKSDRVVAYQSKSGKELWRLEGAGRKGFESAAITSDGSTVAIGMGEGLIKLHEAKSGKHLRTFNNGKKSVSHLEFSADGRTLLAVEAARVNPWQFDVAATLHVWDVKAGKQIREWKEQFCRAAALSPDGKTVACDSQGIPWLYDVASGLSVPKLKPRGAQLSWATFGPAGMLALGYFNRIELWDVRKNELVREISAEAYHVAFRWDGRMLAMNSGWEVGKWAHFSLIDLKTGKRAFDLPGIPGSIGELSVSGDGKFVVAATFLGETLVWDARTGRQVGRLPPPRRDVHPWGVQILRGGTSLAGVGIRTSKVGWRDRSDIILWGWDFRHGRELWPEMSLGEEGRSFSFDPRGVLFAHRTESTVTVRNLTTGNPWRKVPLEKDDRGVVGWVYGLFFAPAGNTLAVSQDLDSPKRVVNVWDLKLNKVVGKVRTERNEYGGVFGFAVHGRHLLGTHSFRAEWRAWDLWDGSERTLKKLPPNISRSGYRSRYTVSPNGLWIARTNQTDVKLIEFATGQVVLTWQGDPTFPDDPARRPCAWMPDSKRLVVALRPPLVLDLTLCADAPKAAGLSGEKRQAAIWADLESHNAAIAFRAICWLARHPDEALPLLEKHLKPVPGPDLAPLRKLIAQLDADDFATREAAEAKLQKVGYPVKRLLEEVVGSGNASAEQLRRTRRLLAAIEVPATFAERLREDVARLRSLQVLEWINSPRARKHMKALSQGDPDVALTRYARSALALVP
jgi:WD40 repeat protein